MSILDVDYTIEEQKILPQNKRKDLNFPSKVDPVSGKTYYKGNILKSFIDALLSGSVQWFHTYVSKPFCDKFIRQSNYNITTAAFKSMLNYELENDATLSIIYLEDGVIAPDIFYIGGVGICSYIKKAQYITEFIMQPSSVAVYDLNVRYPASYSSSKLEFIRRLAVKYSTPSIKIIYTPY